MLNWSLLVFFSKSFDFIIYDTNVVGLMKQVWEDDVSVVPGHFFFHSSYLGLFRPVSKIPGALIFLVILILFSTDNLCHFWASSTISSSILTLVCINECFATISITVFVLASLLHNVFEKVKVGRLFGVVWGQYSPLHFNCKYFT